MAKTPQEIAVEALLALLAVQREKVAWLERSIAHLKEFRANDTLPELGNHAVKPGQYRSMSFGQAMLAYLGEHGEVLVQKLIADLMIGGVDTLVKQKTAGERRRRMLITISNNKAKLVYSPETDTVSLRARKNTEVQAEAVM